jgi:predicted metal-dependent hydrolase
VQLQFLFREGKAPRTLSDVLTVDDRQIPIVYVRHRRAKHYILRLRDDGAVRLTVPWYGSRKEALKFANTRLDWITEQLNKPAEESSHPTEWNDGTPILFRGKMTPLSITTSASAIRVSFADQGFSARGKNVDVRAAVQTYLWELARPELTHRTHELAVQRRLEVRRVTVRNQRARWGSCSAKKSISLNWRLIMTPEFVRDYVIIHELMHLKQLNHSKKYWGLVEDACPDYRKAETWLKENAGILK